MIDSLRIWETGSNCTSCADLGICPYEVELGTQTIEQHQEYERWLSESIKMTLGIKPPVSDHFKINCEKPLTVLQTFYTGLVAMPGKQDIMRKVVVELVTSNVKEHVAAEVERLISEGKPADHIKIEHLASAASKNLADFLAWVELTSPITKS
jgi:hypothetical protein